MPYVKYAGRYFAAANSGDGFVSRFDEIFGSLPRLYIIKGGSGTGKSRMMGDIANEAEARGYTVGRYYCSADADSLDGVVICELGVGMIDGTAPHVTDPKYPGAVDEIVDLGRFWDRGKLEEHGGEIKDLIDRKRRLFGCAYALLSSAKNADSVINSMQDAAIDLPKLIAAAARLTRHWKSGSGFRKYTRILDAFTMKGRARLNSFAESADRIYTVGGRHGAGDRFLREIIHISELKGHPVFVAPDPLNMTSVLEIMIPELGIAFVRDAGDREVEKHINTERFIIPELLRPFKPCLTEAKRLKRGALDSVDVILSEAAKIHFRLEEIYGSAMDFTAKEELTRALTERILG